MVGGTPTPRGTGEFHWGIASIFCNWAFAGGMFYAIFICAGIYEKDLMAEGTSLNLLVLEVCVFALTVFRYREPNPESKNI